MKKYLSLFIFLACTCIWSTVISIEISLEPSSVTTFSKNGYCLKLKRTGTKSLNDTSKYRLNKINDETLVNFSYVYEVKYPISKNDSTIYLEFLDNDGFKVEAIRIGTVKENFTGVLRGNFDISLGSCRKIKDIDLSIMFRSEI